MAKRRISTGLRKQSLKTFGETTLAVVAGMAAGAAAQKFITKKSVNGTDLLGLSGSASSFAGPTIITCLGLGAGMLAPNSFLQKAAIGLAAVGGAGIVNATLGKNAISLNGDDDDDIVPALPGVAGDDVPTYDELPTNNELMTAYQPHLQPVGDVDVEDYEPDFRGVGALTFDEGILVDDTVNGTDELL